MLTIWIYLSCNNTQAFYNQGSGMYLFIKAWITGSEIDLYFCSRGTIPVTAKSQEELDLADKIISKSTLQKFIVI